MLMITPREVGGTLFGGMFMTLIYLSGWLLATLSLVTSIACRVLGAKIGLLCSSLVQIIWGLISIMNYPDDYNGNLIFSPGKDEIFVLLVIVAFTLILGCVPLKTCWLKVKGFLMK
ncbi:hypothetical protein CIG19_13905 [Enterobacterales bacterium CwR94]|nr:hypothetical protein CIG19_13905 [Enterobacterales bacterium CwR94]